MLFKEWSGRAVLLLFVVFTIAFLPKLKEVSAGKDRCVCAYDGFGYYMYNPALFSQGTLFMQPEWAQGLQDKYCGGIEAYQLSLQQYDNHLDVYHMGLAYLQLPAYLIGHAFANVLGYPTDGFSTPYYIMYLINVLLFIFLGLLYLRKVLRLFFSDQLSALLILLTYLATNVYITFTQQYDLPHLYLFFLNATFAYHLVRYTRGSNGKSLLYAAIILGLTSAIRPTQAVLGIIPLLILYKEFGNSKIFWKKLLLFPLFGLIWNIPQIIYWQIVGGEPFITNLHSEDIVLSDPNLLDFLFSYRKGWLLYTPFFLLLIPGFVVLYRLQRTLFYPFLSAAILFIYVMSAWECWWYATSFSARVMVDIYPLLITVVGFGIMVQSKTWQKISIGIFILAALCLNIFQSWQYTLWYIHGTRMSKQQYWYVFGRTNYENLTNIHLLIERSDLGCLNREFPEDQYELITKTIYTLPKPIQTIPGQDLKIDRLNIFELLESDESQLSVRIKVKSSDTTKSSLLKLETVSKYNCYSWDQLEISQGIPMEGATLYLNYNLPDIRHRKDQIQMYVDNDAAVSVKIEEIEIIATSLLRK